MTEFRVLFCVVPIKRQPAFGTAIIYGHVVHAPGAVCISGDSAALGVNFQGN
jgi:hypothetical protein